MKRIVPILLLCLVSCYATAYDFEVDGVYYTVTNRFKRTVEVTHWEEMTDKDGRPQRVCHHDCCAHDHTGHLSRHHRKLIQMDEDAVLREKAAYKDTVIVPETVRYRGIKYSVVGIGVGSFFGRKQLTKVVLPHSITYIGDAAFENCHALCEMSLPSSVNAIGMAAFRRCMALTELTLSEGLKTVDLYAFAFCEHLTHIQLPASLDTIPGNVFFHCVRLKRITLPHAVPPVVTNDNGLKMDFKNIIFYVPEAALPLYQADAFWRERNVQVIQ